MNVRINARDLNDQGLRLITPSDEEFNSLFASVDQSVKAVRPYSVFIQNNGALPVVAFMLKWDFVKPGAELSTRTYEYCTNWSLRGQGTEGKGGYVIRPQSEWLFLPGVGLEIGDTRNPPDALLARIAEDMEPYTNITVSLDGAFFADGDFVGPNTTGFFEKVVALCNAQRDLLQEIARKKMARESDDEILQDLELLTQEPEVRLNRDSGIPEYYNRFKADYAESLVRMKKVSGSEKTINYHLELLKKQWLKLHKREH